MVKRDFRGRGQARCSKCGNQKGPGNLKAMGCAYPDSLKAVLARMSKDNRLVHIHRARCSWLPSMSVVSPDAYKAMSSVLEPSRCLSRSVVPTILAARQAEPPPVHRCDMIEDPSLRFPSGCSISTHLQPRDSELLASLCIGFPCTRRSRT